LFFAFFKKVVKNTHLALLICKMILNALIAAICYSKNETALAIYLAKAVNFYL
jgi:hypothetical protein